MFSVLFFFFKQKTAYEMRISDWSSDVCSSDLSAAPRAATPRLIPAPSRSSATGSRASPKARRAVTSRGASASTSRAGGAAHGLVGKADRGTQRGAHHVAKLHVEGVARRAQQDSEEHTSELHSLMRISYAVFCLKKKKKHQHKS